MVIAQLIAQFFRSYFSQRRETDLRMSRIGYSEPSAEFFTTYYLQTLMRRSEAVAQLHADDIDVRFLLSVQQPTDQRAFVLIDRNIVAEQMRVAINLTDRPTDRFELMNCAHKKKTRPP